MTSSARRWSFFSIYSPLVLLILLQTITQSASFTARSTTNPSTSILNRVPKSASKNCFLKGRIIKPLTKSILGQFHPFVEVNKGYQMRFQMSNDESSNIDEGWDEATLMKEEISTKEGLDEKSSTDNVDTFKLQQQRELEALRSASNKSSSSSLPSSSLSEEDGSRDTFVPVFALISLMGLFGSYGFEMLRLYSKGELYLPWNN